jgi:large subunit ribosomal protein L22
MGGTEVEAAEPGRRPERPAAGGRPARAARAEEAGQPAVVSARAVARFVRASPRKVGIVCDAIRGKPVGEALAVLQFLPQRAARLVEGVVRSAVANATHNYDLDPQLLYVASVTADPGPMWKRIHPRARGRAFPILKRTCHIGVVVRQRSG